MQTIMIRLLYDALKSSRIHKYLAHTRNPYGSSKWKVPAHHRPYLLHTDYLKTSNGSWIPDLYEFSGEDGKAAMEHISIYISQLGLLVKKIIWEWEIFLYLLLVLPLHGLHLYHGALLVHGLN
jgi:hypothetical protein